ncbi:helix-turn-helix domain-containing protein [Peteryoungia ipomoeae]|uniref:XRE family transcriptional regulator n=1 Tax=Peteryoungia ipomoeae TaxID=1210932 RepID=A0A4S8NZI8_9HYPH|nr:XRE family transcriptional regulator [Peteryoungia ipomoeae]THV23167.1 XRE family transcriptional regulator [Peteryoungia ipomoeae]
MQQLDYDNIFDVVADNPAEAADLQFRTDLMLTLRKLLVERNWRQAEIAETLGVSQPRVSELMRGKIDLFSADKLIGLLARLDVRLRPSVDASGRVICEVVQAA